VPNPRKPGMMRAAYIPNIPAPHHDELLHSAIARAAVHLGHWSPKGLLAAIYGDRGQLACPDLPGSISLLRELAKDCWSLSIEELARRHTLFGYYTYFLEPAQRTAVLQAMMHRSGHLHVRLGVCSGSVRRIPFFRLCPSCTREDLERHGETYWRRTHHLPGVAVCALHGDDLLETAIPYRAMGRHEHVAAHPRLIARARPVLESIERREVALAIARSSAGLLESLSVEARPDYRQTLRFHGFIGRYNGGARFRQAVRRAIPVSLLAAMFTSVDTEGAPGWLDRMRRKPRRSLHPLCHVVTRLVLDALPERGDVPKVNRRPDLRGKSRDQGLRARAAALMATGLSTHAIALRLGVEWETAHRLLTPLKPPAPIFRGSKGGADRNEWTALRTRLPGATKSELRRTAPALYMRLYRADKRWLSSQAGAPAKRKPVIRIDWAGRDADLAGRIAAAAQEMRSRAPLTRVTRSRILGELQLRSLLAHKSANLPKTLAALVRHCETVEAFQARRLIAVMRSQPKGCGLGELALLRAANINVDRLPDRGARLLAQAKGVAA